METPSPTDRRQAWVRGSRHWQPLEDPEPQSTQGSLTSHTLHDGNGALGLLYIYLTECRIFQKVKVMQFHVFPEPLLRPGSSFEDDLSLGAEGEMCTHLCPYLCDCCSRCCPLLQPPPRSRNKGPVTSTPNQKLGVPLPHLGHSMASSGLSSTTNRTASSVSEVLQLYMEDAEHTLYELGFGCDEPQVTARIPSRFFSFPSQLQGINFRLFLESQLSRLRQEDPSLSLASRFRQVEVLTAMANAFYSLYSHVSRTPLQKLAPPDLNSASPVESKIGTRFFSHIRNEPKSPVERLKDTVSKMCLYTGPSLRSPDSIAPHSSLHRQCSLPEVQESVFETGLSRPLLGRGAEEGVMLGDKECGGVGEVANQDTNSIQLLDASQTLHSEAGDSPSMSTDLQPSCKKGCSEPTLDLPKQANIITPSNAFFWVSKFTRDFICPQIVECVNQMPFSKPVSPTAPPLQWGSRSDGPIAPSLGHYALGEEPVPTAIDSNTHDRDLGPDGPRHFSSFSPSYPDAVKRKSLCQITVTGWEEDAVSDDVSCSTQVRGTEVSTVPSLQSNHSYLSPSRPPALGQAPHSAQQANSFELEEVHSAGEEDPGQLESKQLKTLPLLSAVDRHRELLIRGDSLQSDSSGYAEEDHLLPAPPDKDCR
ncbi:protein TESPA1 [Arapaima gigas]